MISEMLAGFRGEKLTAAEKLALGRTRFYEFYAG